MVDDEEEASGSGMSGGISPDQEGVWMPRSEFMSPKFGAEGVVEVESEMTSLRK